MNITINSIILDRKIEAANVLVQLSIKDYLVVAKPILDENSFQRKRVIKSAVSRQLKEDLKIGCTMPPIILAVKNDLLSDDFNYKTSNNDSIKDIVLKAFEDKKLLIIDGLQRTNVLIDLYQDLASKSYEGEQLEKLLNHSIRAEIYVGIDKLGILYRMITLNSGQQTMSLRHLIEILYADYQEETINGIHFHTQKQGRTIPDTTEDFNFKDIIDGFNAYITESEHPLTKVSILDNIQNIAKLASIREHQKDAFMQFVLSYQKMLEVINKLSADWEYNEAEIATEYQLANRPFGKKALNIFKKPQVIFGFGVGLRKAIKSAGKNLEEISEEFDSLLLNNPDDTFNLLLKRLDEVRSNSKISIGAAQRVFFKLFFTVLLVQNPYEPDIYLNLDNAIEKGMQQTSMELNFSQERSSEEIYA